MNALSEALAQVVEPIDFDSARRMLSRVKAEDACAVPSGAPYSLATNVQHAAIWQDAWLHFVKGEQGGVRVGPGSTGDDWPEIAPEDWPAVRANFLDGLAEALELARRDGWSDDQLRRLVRIAVHGAYHLGQFKLLKRLAKP